LTKKPVRERIGLPDSERLKDEPGAASREPEGEGKAKAGIDPKASRGAGPPQGRGWKGAVKGIETSGAAAGSPEKPGCGNHEGRRLKLKPLRK